MIVVRTPLRVSFLGGGTDFDDFFTRYGGAVISTAIDKYVYIIVKKRYDNLIRVSYSKQEVVETVDELEHEIIREAMKSTGITRGVEIITLADVPSHGTGLGSSSSVSVGLLQALYAYKGENKPPDVLAREACRIEIDILKKPIGRQDQYIAAYGDMQFITFDSDGVSLERIDIPDEDKRRFEKNLLLFDTGLTRNSNEVLAEQLTNIELRLDTLNTMRDSAYQARELIAAGAFDDFGLLLDENWELKKQLSSLISNPEIDGMYQAARSAGALGGKITGSGGGGFLLLYCPRERKGSVRAALGDLRELPFRFERSGSRILYSGIPEVDGRFGCY
ncbi:MAG: GHMP kinase [Chloroflexi bacterium RBG_13_46_14]|nr:MAG: GHMP kinase [Chloroflexi bacterium RBG_13_46_14]